MPGIVVSIVDVVKTATVESIIRITLPGALQDINGGTC